MSALSFFLSSGDIPSMVQSDTDAYGPVKDHEDVKYRVTSKLPVDTKNVFSVVEGEIIVCNVSGSENTDKVNIFLKPTINYASLYYTGMPKVKYFVYRGVKKSSFFDTNNNVKTSITENEVLKTLNTGIATTGIVAPATRRQNFKDSFEDITNLANTYPDPNDNTNILSNLVDTLFVKEDYNQIKVDSGDKLGICGSDFGFEIMLEENGFNPTIEQAKLLENIIDTTVDTTPVKKKIKQLEILNYIDPAAFFGLFFRKDSRVIDPKNGKGLTSSRACYNLFLSKLKTGTRIYVDIRNKFALPVTINTSGKSFSQIKVSVDGSTPSTARNYQYFKKDTTIISTWPIHIMDESFSNPVPQGAWYDYFKINVAIENKNPKEFFHVITSHLGASWKKERVYTNEQKFEKLIDQDSNWKNHVELHTYKANNTKPVASYIRVEVTQYSDEKKINDQIVNYKLDQFSFENITHQLSPTLINLGHSNDLTRGRDVINNVNKYNLLISGLGTTTYSETRGIGCELTQGKAIDSIGEVCFSYRTSKSLQINGIDFYKDVENKNVLKSTVKLANNGERSNQINKDLYSESFVYNRIKNNYAEVIKTHIDVSKLRGKYRDVFRSYDELVQAHNEHKKNKSIISVHKVKFTDGGDKKGIELRINDPIMIRGLIGNSPAECFLSIAYTYLERQAIQNIIKNNFETARFVSFISDTNNDITTSGRKLFKQTFKLLGLKLNGNDLELQEEILDLIFYSFDGTNFITADYANGYKNEEGINNTLVNKVITNDIIPEFDTGNPFNNSNFATDTYTSIKTLLTTISNGGARNKILYNEIRDYLYDGDLDNLTYEIAFRLPFYIEDVTQTPYTMISQNGVTVDNNPFINFYEQDTPTEEWFTEAQTLRTKQLSPTLETFAYSGLTTSTSIKKIFEKEFYTIANTKREAHFITVNLPVNAATTFNWENPKSYFNRKGKHPHLPIEGKYSSAIANTYNLTHLNSAIPKVITNVQKTTLEAIATTDFGYVPIADGTYSINGVSKTLNGKYVFTEKNETTFKIYDFTWTNDNNASGITFGFGYDIGSRSNYNKLLNYLNINSTSVTGIKQTVFNNALGKKRIDAQKEFWPFKNAVWNTISLDYNITIDKTKPILQDEYLNVIQKNVVKNRQYLKVYKSTESQFYKDEQMKILNLAELCVYSTFVWNRGADRANLNYSLNSLKPYKVRRAKHVRRLIHAINTHDIRWLRHFVEESGIYHKDRVIKFLSLPEIIKHYRK